MSTRDEEPFEDRADEDWAIKAADTLAWLDRGREWVLQGPCPRCGHEISKAIPEDVWIAEDLRAGPVTLVVACNCSHVHPGRPEGRTGCGLYGGLLVDIEK
jgi:hypothetical protein